MALQFRSAIPASLLLITLLVAGAAFAQKPGGILKMYSPDSPASMSIHEEITNVAQGPMMGVFNNLVMFDQHVKQNSLQSIVPIWRPAGRGTRTAPSSAYLCGRASNGTTDSRSPPMTSNALGTC